MNWGLFDPSDKIIGQFITFDEAVQALAKMPGEWAANWSNWELIKGHYRVLPL